MLNRFNQVKLSSVGSKNVFDLFKKFKLDSILLQSKIVKQKGHKISEMLFSFLIIILENSNSIFSGIVKNNSSHLKTPINDMLNNPHYNWRNLLYRIAKRFSQLCPASDITDCSLIFDDTSKVKTGHKTQNISWFYDHSKSWFFKGYQNITSAWSNGKQTIPLDFELKIGKKRTKHSRKAKYPVQTHTAQRVRFAKQKKINIVLQMIKRAKQRKLPFKYVLWDSWFNCTKSYSFIFKELVPAGKVLISMLKKGTQKYKYRNRFLNLKELYRKAGKWSHDRVSGIKYKSIEIELLDVSTANKIEDRTVIGKVKVCLFKYPNVKRWKAIISTDTNLSEIEVLKIYLRRWSIECIFKEIRQYFGYAQGKSSNYAAMVADLTIRYVFYTMFCYRKEQSNNKPMGQLVLEFYQELFDMWLSTFVEMMFVRYAKDFVDYAIELGYTNLFDLQKNIDKLLQAFFEREVWIDKINEADNNKFVKSA